MALHSLTRRQALGLLAAPFTLPLLSACGTDRLLSPLSLDETTTSHGSLTLFGAGDPHSKINNRGAERVGRQIKAMLDSTPGARAFALGDLTASGTREEFQVYYHAAWGAFRDITDFQVGNHDLLSDAAGTSYYDYAAELAGPRGKGYYAKTYGNWRCYFLNSQAWKAEQTAWLATDLPNWSGYHILAMWHQPIFASVCAHHGKAMTHPKTLGLWWQLLQDHGAEFVVVGHVHRYERFARMLRDGTVSDQGIREFIVGTGGAKPMNILTVHPHSEVQVINRGVIRLDLLPDRYEWTFTDVSGQARDKGSQMCRKVVQVPELPPDSTEVPPPPDSTAVPAA